MDTQKGLKSQKRCGDNDVDRKEAKIMSIPKKFTREEWDFGYLEKKDAMRVLGLGKSSLDNYQKEHEIKKGYKKRNGNDSIAVYRLRDVYHLAIQKKGEWVGIERPLVMEASLDTDAEYKSTKSKSDIVETKNENLALPEELITLLIKNGMNDAMKDYMKEHSMEVKPSLSKKKRLSLFAVGGVVISALIVVPVWILSDTFETFHKDSVTQLSNEYGKLIEANGEAHAKEKTSLKKEAVQSKIL